MASLLSTAMLEPSQRFARSDRILKRETFKRVYEQGRKFTTKYFTAFVLSNPARQTRIGITTTRKIGSAVERNRARRLVREAYRRNKALVPSGLDIVVNPRRLLVEAAYGEFETDFVSFLGRLA
ncbi:MAG TPA: ribonuclease P protein component [Blastocatellia bacterium]|nr:ribonuclease P protein component [Blastocatellia bacterium]